MHKPIIAVLIGTRPEAIKLAPVCLALLNDQSFDCQVILTGQHSEMAEQVLRLFEIKPNLSLSAMNPGQTLDELSSRLLTQISSALRDIRPQRMIVQGDTTTAFTGSLAAFYQKTPVAHVEAGLRSGRIDSPWPEEMNRILISKIADIHFAPTESAKNNLINEGVNGDGIFVTGNTVIDALNIICRRTRNTVLNYDREIIKSDKKLILVTGHRRESFGAGLANVCAAINEISKREDVNIIFPIHPNPNVKKTVFKKLGNKKNVQLVEPLPYEIFIRLMSLATLIISDSGGIQEEASALGKPLLITRELTERPEAVNNGTGILVGLDDTNILKIMIQILDDHGARTQHSKKSNCFGDGKACERIIDCLCNIHL